MISSIHPNNADTESVSSQLLNNRYKLLRALGAGGMGQTYLAEDAQKSDSNYVIKQLKPANTDPSFVATARRLFSEEAAILERLGHHDQIPGFLNYFEQDQEFYLVQEFVEGHPLSAELTLGQRLSEPQVVQILQDVLSVLEFVHSQGVIHRDIKPDNLIRRPDGKLVLIDFSAVKQVRMQPTVAVGQVSITVAIGTPGYMPTEQASGKPRPNSDIYALGMLAIQALTGLLPTQLREDHDGEVVWREQAEVSDALADVLTKMTRHFFKHRYQSAREALSALRSITYVDDSEKSTHPPRATPSDPAKSTFNSSSTEGHQPYPKTQEVENAEQTPTQQIADSQFWGIPTAPTTPLSGHGQSSAKSSPSTAPSTSKKSRWLMGGVAVALVGLVGGGGYWTYNQMQYNEQRDRLAEIGRLKASGDYKPCVEQAGNFPGTYQALKLQADNLLEDCQTTYSQQLFAEAENFAASDRFLDAMNRAKQIPPSVPIYVQAQPKISGWSNKILEAAANQYQKGDLETALKWAGVIPKDSAAYAKAQDSSKQWQAEWKTNEETLSTARKALDEGRWGAAIEAAEKLTTNHWKQQAKPIIDRANDELYLSDAQTALNERRWNDAIYLANQTVTDSGWQKAQSIIATANRMKPIHEEGNLSQGDRYQEYSFEGEQGQVVTITMASRDFDTFLTLIDPNGQEIERDDDSGEDTDALLTVTLPGTGEYTVRASAYEGHGEYTLTISRN